MYGMPNTFFRENYTNKFGQVIEPGEVVICVTNAWKNTHVTDGIFLGVYKNDEGHIESVSVLKAREYYEEHLNEGFKEDDPWKSGKYRYTKATKYVPTSLPRKRIYKMA